MKLVLHALLALLLVPSIAIAQQANKSESILLKGFSKETPDSVAGSEIQRLYLLKDVSVEKCESHLLKLLDSSSIELVTTACEFLIDKSGQKHQQEIVETIGNLKPQISVDYVRLALVQAQLGDAAAVEKLHTWAKLEVQNLPKEHLFVCPMMCVEPMEKAGRCSVCRMEMVEQDRRELDQEDYEAQSLALKELHELAGKDVPELARRIITGNAPAYYRLNAAYYWALCEPDEAYPHLKLFLGQPGRHTPALFYLAEIEPKRMLAEFEAIVANNDDDQFERFEAYCGLITAGKTEYLKRVRRSLNEPDAKDGSNLDAFLNIAILSKYGVEADIPSLEKHFETERKLLAAKAILAILTRTQSGK